MPEKKTVTGIILPNDWDSQGRLVEVVLYGEDESEFAIDGALESDLFGLCHHRVRCTGRQGRDMQGRWMLDVEKYIVLGDSFDSGYEQDLEGVGIRRSAGKRSEIDFDAAFERGESVK